MDGGQRGGIESERRAREDRGDKEEEGEAEEERGG